MYLWLQISPKGEHLQLVIHAGSSCELAPLLVPFVEVSVSHDEGVYLFDGFGLCLGRDELLFEVSFELYPRPIGNGIGQ